MISGGGRCTLSAGGSNRGDDLDWPPTPSRMSTVCCRAAFMLRCTKPQLWCTPVGLALATGRCCVLLSSTKRRCVPLEKVFFSSFAHVGELLSWPELAQKATFFGRGRRASVQAVRVWARRMTKVEHVRSWRKPASIFCYTWMKKSPATACGTFLSQHTLPSTGWTTRDSPAR